MTTVSLDSGGEGVKETMNTTAESEPPITSFLEYQIAVVIRNAYPPFTFLLGGFGNVAIILVMRRIKDHNSSQYAILMTLAVFDLFILYFGALVDWLKYLFQVDIRIWHVVVCKLHTWVIYSINTVSAWLVTCMTVQRTMAVLWPHRMKVMCTVRRTWIVILALVSTGCALHFHFLIGMVIDEDHRCNVAAGSYKHFYRHVYTLLDMCVSSLVPCLVQLVCDAILSLTLFKAMTSSNMAATSSTDTAGSGDNRRKTASRTTVMVLIVSGTFLILTMPVCVCLVWLNYSHTTILHSSQGLATMELTLAVAVDLWYSNSAVNFLLYCLTGTKFRREFLSLIHCGGGGGQKAVGEVSAGKKN